MLWLWLLVYLAAGVVITAVVMPWWVDSTRNATLTGIVMLALGWPFWLVVTSCIAVRHLWLRTQRRLPGQWPRP